MPTGPADIRLPSECRETIRAGALVAISTSGGKDSQAMTVLLSRIVPRDQLVAVHAPLGEVEWPGTIEHIRATLPPGVPLILAPVASGKTLLDRVEERGMWPDPARRWCTSDYKTGPIERELRRNLKAIGGCLRDCKAARPASSTHNDGIPEPAGRRPQRRCRPISVSVPFGTFRPVGVSRAARRSGERGSLSRPISAGFTPSSTEIPMVDAQPAPDAHARPPLPPAVIDPHAEPERPVAGDAVFASARTLLPVLEAGRTLDAAILRDAMTDAFGGSDASGAWVWKDAYEAAEAACVLFLQRYGRGMRRTCGAGADGPRRMLAMLEAVAALEPSHTRRSEEQVRLQQFSTPLPLAYAALQAAAIRPGDTVLEPSAGTGMLAVMAQCALGNSVTGNLHLNEYAQTRARLLTRLFPQAIVTAFNAESIADRLHDVRPTVVLMNPPFSATPGVDRSRHDADLRHVRSAASMLPPGGRLVTITSAHCVLGDTVGRLDPPARCIFTIAIDGRAYARRGTGFDTRLSVLERGDGPAVELDGTARAANAAELLDAFIAQVPKRQPIAPVPIPARPARDLFGKPVAPKPAKRGPKSASTS